MISVIIPVYNVEKYLQQCIDSLLNQTLEQCEFIFVNDASTDHSPEILEKNRALHPEHIRVIDSKQNLRQGGARNLGLKAARGKYIGYVDADDFVHPDMFRELYQRAEQTEADAVFIQYTLVNEDAMYSLEYPWEEKPPLIVWDERLRNCSGKVLDEQGITDILALPVGGVYCGIYRKDMLTGSGIEFPEKIRYEDNYWDGMIKPSFRKVEYIDKIRYFYRENTGSTLHIRNQEYQYYDRVETEKKLLADAKRAGYYKRFQNAYEWIYLYRYALNTYDLYIRHSHSGF